MIRTTHFNPRSPHGERPPFDPPDDGRTRFQSTLPARGASKGSKSRRASCPISIHAPRTGSDGAEVCPAPAADISIHAPRTGSDSRRTDPAEDPNQISIHAPRTGSDTRREAIQLCRDEFQSTLPARGATGICPEQEDTMKQFQSTLPARGATAECPEDFAALPISIHAPRTGSDSAK